MAQAGRLGSSVAVGPDSGAVDNDADRTVGAAQIGSLLPISKDDGGVAFHESRSRLQAQRVADQARDFWLAGRLQVQQALIEALHKTLIPERGPVNQLMPSRRHQAEEYRVVRCGQDHGVEAIGEFHRASRV